MAETRCPHDMVEAWCASCNGTAAKLAQENRQTLDLGPPPRGVTIARFPSYCGECDDDIEVGQEIIPTSAEYGKARWVHLVCPHYVS